MTETFKPKPDFSIKEVSFEEVAEQVDLTSAELETLTSFLVLTKRASVRQPDGTEEFVERSQD